MTTVKAKIEYVISPVTSYNEWEELWETKVGTNEKGMPLHYIVCGKTEKESRERSEELISIVTNRNVS